MGAKKSARARVAELRDLIRLHDRKYYVENAPEIADGEYDAEAMDAAMIESMLAFPAATEGKGNEILQPEILADGTKKFVLEASVIEWEVSQSMLSR